MSLVLLDRDGVINENLANSVHSKEELVLLPGAGDAISKLNKSGRKVAVITNQAIVGKGFVTEEQMEELHAYLNELLLSKYDAHIDRFYVCTDAHDGISNRRKPEAGMLEEALSDFDADPLLTPFIGDARRDLEASFKVRCPFVLVLTGHGKQTFLEGFQESLKPFYVAKDLYHAVEFLLNY